MNFNVSNPEQCLQKIYEIYAMAGLSFDRKDGLSVSFTNWRFNLRQSNTEPLVRLNVETKNDEVLLIEKTKELSDIILASEL